MPRKKEKAPADSKLRDPDFLFEILQWVDEAPRPTAMESKGFGDKGPAAKLSQNAQVRNPENGKVAVVPVVGTALQFKYASNAFVEVYQGSDKKTLYFNPHLDRAGVAADTLL